MSAISSLCSRLVVAAGSAAPDVEALAAPGASTETSARVDMGGRGVGGSSFFLLPVPGGEGGHVCEGQSGGRGMKRREPTTFVVTPGRGGLEGRSTPPTSAPVNESRTQA